MTRNLDLTQDLSVGIKFNLKARWRGRARPDHPSRRKRLGGSLSRTKTRRFGASFWLRLALESPVPGGAHDKVPERRHPFGLAKRIAINQMRVE